MELTKIGKKPKNKYNLGDKVLHASSNQGDRFMIAERITRPVPLIAVHLIASKPMTASQPIREAAMSRPLLLFYQNYGLKGHHYQVAQ